MTGSFIFGIFGLVFRIIGWFGDKIGRFLGLFGGGVVGFFSGVLLRARRLLTRLGGAFQILLVIAIALIIWAMLDDNIFIGTILATMLGFSGLWGGWVYRQHFRARGNWRMSNVMEVLLILVLAGATFLWVYLAPGNQLTFFRLTVPFGILVFGVIVAAIWGIYVFVFRKQPDEIVARAVLPFNGTETTAIQRGDDLSVVAAHDIAGLQVLPRRDPPAGYIYIIRDVSVSGYHKIGRTNYPARRLGRFVVKLPFEIEFVHIFESRDCIEAESALHQRFANKRVRGEWFNLDDADVRYLKSIGAKKVSLTQAINLEMANQRLQVATQPVRADANEWLLITIYLLATLVIVNTIFFGLLLFGTLNEGGFFV